MAHKTDFCALKGLAEVAKRTFRATKGGPFLEPPVPLTPPPINWKCQRLGRGSTPLLRMFEGS